MLRASIDIGSNSVLLICAEINSDNKIVRELINESRMTSLGKDLDKNLFILKESFDATFEALSFYSYKLKDLNVPPVNVIVTATEACRVARNFHELQKKVHDELGFSITLLSGTGEAYYTALGVSTTMKSRSREEIEKPVVIMDIGGASTELIKLRLDPFEVVESISLPVGSVRALDWSELNTIEVQLDKIMARDFSIFETPNLICVAGSMTAMASMYQGLREFNAEKIEGLEISFEDFKLFSEELQRTSQENLRLQFPYLEKRIPLMGVASKIAVRFGKVLGIKKMSISTRGLRYGTLLTERIHEKFINK